MKFKGLQKPRGFGIWKPGLTQSLIMTYNQCRIKFLLKLNGFHVENLKVGFGNVFHNVIEKVYKYRMRLKKERLIKFINFYFDEEKNKLDLLINDLNMKEKVELIKLINIINNYVSYYKESDRKKEFIFLEKEFAVGFRGKFTMLGKADGLFKINNEYWLFEHKTKKRIDVEKIAKKLIIDFQSLFYITALEKMLNIKIKGVLYNVVRNPNHSPNNKENLNDFSKRLNREIKYNIDNFFYRFPVSYSEEDKEIFKGDLDNNIVEIAYFLSLVNDKFPLYKNQNHCVNLWECEYFDLCCNGVIPNGFEQYGDIFPELDTINFKPQEWIFKR